MTKYLETAKIKKHSETIGLHPYLGNRGAINMINGSRGYRRRGATRRGTTPTRQRHDHLHQDLLLSMTRLRMTYDNDKYWKK
eukprot:2813180-Amphidinium_carterae.5